ncbi:hypothetical protein HDU91_003780, partial [Kappamyces sp. JEL0680]
MRSYDLSRHVYVSNQNLFQLGFAWVAQNQSNIYSAVPSVQKLTVGSAVVEALSTAAAHKEISSVLLDSAPVLESFLGLVSAAAPKGLVVHALVPESPAALSASLTLAAQAGWTVIASSSHSQVQSNSLLAYLGSWV